MESIDVRQIGISRVSSDVNTCTGSRWTADPAGDLRF